MTFTLKINDTIAVTTTKVRIGKITAFGKNQLVYFTDQNGRETYCYTCQIDKVNGTPINYISKSH